MEELNLEKELTVHLPDHQILLSFNNDSGASCIGVLRRYYD